MNTVGIILAIINALVAAFCYSVFLGVWDHIDVEFDDGDDRITLGIATFCATNCLIMLNGALT